jgi:HEAT repeat protein
MGLFGPPDVARLKGRGDVPGLIKALGYENVEIRKTAAEALGEIRDARAIEPLVVAVVEDRNDQVKVEAAVALAAYGDYRAVGPLVALASTMPSPDRRAAAALLTIADPRAVEPLISALGNHQLRLSAAAALGSIGDPRAIGPLNEALSKTLALNSDAERILRNERNPGLQLEASWAIDRRFPKAATNALEKIMRRTASPLEAALAALASDSRPVRETAAETLKSLGWEPGNAETAAAFWEARGDLGRCVGLGGVAVVPLTRVLVDKSLALPERQAAADALARIGAPSVRPMIDMGYVLGIAADALVRIGAPAVGPLVTALSDERDAVAEAASSILSRIGSLAVQDLLGALTSANEAVRKGAAMALGAIGDAWAVELLSSTLGYDVIWSVREAAAFALGRIGDARAHDPLLAAALNDQDGNVRRAAATALARIGAPGVESLIAALSDANQAVRKSAAEALGHIRDARAVEPLFVVLDSDSDADVREAAARALTSIGRKW